MPTRNHDILYTDGSEFPLLNKKVKVLIQDGTDYVVFLDENYEVQYYIWDEYNYWLDVPECNAYAAFDTVVARYSVIEGFAIANFTSKSDKNVLKQIQSYLGEAVASVFDQRKFSAEAEALLFKADTLLKDRKKEISISISIQNVIIICIIMLAYWNFRNLYLNEYFPNYYISEDIFQVTFCSLFGGIGAFLSFYQRVNENGSSYYLTKSQFRLDGIMRSLYGVLCALFIALAIKTNFILGTFNKINHSGYFLILFCIAAGFSEKIIANLIKKIEDTLSAKTTSDKVPS